MFSEQLSADAYKKETTQTVFTAMRNLKEIDTIPSETFDKSELLMWRMLGGHTLLKMIQSGCQSHQPIASLPTDTASASHLLGLKTFCPFQLGKDGGSTRGRNRLLHGQFHVYERTGHRKTGVPGPFISGTVSLFTWSFRESIVLQREEEATI